MGSKSVGDGSGDGTGGLSGLSIEGSGFIGAGSGDRADAGGGVLGSGSGVLEFVGSGSCAGGREGIPFPDKPAIACQKVSIKSCRSRDVAADRKD